MAPFRFKAIQKRENAVFLKTIEQFRSETNPTCHPFASESTLVNKLRDVGDRQVGQAASNPALYLFIYLFTIASIDTVASIATTRRRRTHRLCAPAAGTCELIEMVAPQG